MKYKTVFINNQKTTTATPSLATLLRMSLKTSPGTSENIIERNPKIRKNKRSKPNIYWANISNPCIEFFNRFSDHCERSPIRSNFSPHKGDARINIEKNISRPYIVFDPFFEKNLSYFSEFKRIFQKREIHFFAFLSIIFIFSASSFAGDYTAQAQGIVRESQTQRDSNLKTAQDFIDDLSTQTQPKEFSIESQPSSTQADPWGEAPVSEFSESTDQAKTEQTVLENIPDQREGETCCGVPKSLQKQEESHPDLKPVMRGDREFLIFVSFSLPEQALKNLYEESLRLKARLIVRGLHENSFQETRKKAQQLGIQVDIDPTLFEKHAVNVVPTFVLEKGDKSDKVSGNITAQEALSILQGESE